MLPTTIYRTVLVPALFIVSCVPLAVAPQTHIFVDTRRAMSTASAPTTTPASSEWLQQQLSALLASPYIHFNNPPSLPGGHRLGHGPVDLFSTRYNNLFANDAKGIVAGDSVDRDGLKSALLALQSHWQADNASFSPADPADGLQVATRFEWTPKNAEAQAQVSASASVREEGGAMRISELALDGERTLFTK